MHEFNWLPTQLVLDAGQIAVSGFGYVALLQTWAHLVNRNLIHPPNSTRFAMEYSEACVTGLRLHGMISDALRKREKRIFEDKGKSSDTNCTYTILDSDGSRNSRSSSYLRWEWLELLKESRFGQVWLDRECALSFSSPWAYTEKASITNLFESWPSAPNVLLHPPPTHWFSGCVKDHSKLGL